MQVDLGGYVARRLLSSIPILLVMSMVVFGAVLLIPGDPALSYLGADARVDPAAVERLRHQLLLDQPLPVQYAAWLGRALQGDLGISVASRQPVTEALLQRLPVTAELTAIAALLAVLIALPLGTVAAVKRGSVWDTAARGVGVVGLTVPNFGIALLLVLIFAVRLRWMPASGYVGFGDDPLDNLRRMLLPALALGLVVAGVLIRQLRASLLDVLNQEYIRTARAKGVSSWAVVWRHALPNALLPPLTVLGLDVARLLGGSLIVESIFRFPGVGRLMVESIFSHDFQVVQGGTLLIVTLVVALNLVVDVATSIIDPRISRA